MNLATWAIRRPIPPILFFMLFCIAGLFGFSKLPVQHLPDLDYPTVIVTAALPGATPTTIENEVTRILEDSLANIDQIKHIDSVIKNGLSVTSIMFVLEKSPLQAISDVRNAIEQVKNLLPSSMQTPTISRVTTSNGILLSYVVTSEYMSPAELSWHIDNDISKSLLAVEGVGKVSRVGGIEREFRIELDAAKINALKLTPSNISNQIKSVIEERPGGKVTIGQHQQSIRAVSQFKDKFDVENLPIVLPSGNVTTINRIANVIDGTGERLESAYSNGTEVIAFHVQRAQGYSEVDVANNVRNVISTLGENTKGIKFVEVNNTINPVINNYEAAMQTLYEGAALAILAVFLFLKDVRATFVAAVALPLSIIPTFALMYILDFQLNSISLLSMTLIIGVLVDDAIVEIENIERHLATGAPPMKAAMEAANEIGLAVIATSFTLIAVFLPTAFMTGMAGLFFKQFGWTASIAVFFSLLVARLLTPMLAGYVMRSTKHTAQVETDGKLLSTYLSLVRVSLKHPIHTMLIACGFLVLSFGILLQLPTNFVDADDQEQINIEIEMPPGVTLEKTEKIAIKAAYILESYEEVNGLLVQCGIDGDVTMARITAQLLPVSDHVRASQQEIESRFRKDISNITGARVRVKDTNASQQLDIVLVGSDVTVLNSAANSVLNELRTYKGIGAITTTAGLQTPEVSINVNYLKAAELGISPAEISNATRVAFVSDYEQLLPRVNLTERQVYVKTQLPLSERENIQRLENMMIMGDSGLVPLSVVADIEITGGPAKIERKDRLRSITLSIDTENKPLGEINKIVSSLSTLRNLPAGVSQKKAGIAEQQQELFAGFGIAILAGVLCVYAVLVLLFHDFLQPITILSALPLSTGGAFAALALTGNSLSLSSLIGLIMLMGIVSKNSILLIDFTIISRQVYGLNIEEAVLDACRKRSRPVIMTSFAMIAGMIPMAIQLGTPSAFRESMAIAVIGGLITSTVLSLVVVPALYILVDRLKRWLLCWLSKPALR